MRRVDGRAPNELRPTRIIPGYLAYAEGSALIQMGNTWVLCAATVEDRVPPFRKGMGGWITAEYALLPRSTLTRTPREVSQGRGGGRTQEIQRLIGRSLRAVTDLHLLNEFTITVDCDVIQADGGTRTAAITGSYVALYQALQKLVARGLLTSMPLRTAVTAVSVGIVDGQVLLDLCYEEDARAQVDFNVVMTADEEFVEVQGTAEGKPFTAKEMHELLRMAAHGVKQLLVLQNAALEALQT
jgi:ribonuclease PH